MEDSDGDFGVWVGCESLCRKCEGALQYRTWESKCGGYVDYQYRCLNCGHVYWIDGIDS